MAIARICSPCASGNTVDGRNPAPPKKPRNDDSLVNTNKQWLSMVSKWCERIPCIHSSSVQVQTAVARYLQEAPGRPRFFGPCLCRCDSHAVDPNRIRMLTWICAGQSPTYGSLDPLMGHIFRTKGVPYSSIALSVMVLG